MSSSYIPLPPGPSAVDSDTMDIPQGQPGLCWTFRLPSLAISASFGPISCSPRGENSNADHAMALALNHSPVREEVSTWQTVYSDSHNQVCQVLMKESPAGQGQRGGVV